MELRLPGVFQEDIAISSPSLIRAAEAQSTPITQLFLQLQDDELLVIRNRISRQILFPRMPVKIARQQCYNKQQRRIQED